MLEGVLECEDYLEVLFWYFLIRENVGEIKKMELEKLKIDLIFILYEIKVFEIENFEKFVDLNL